MYRKEIKVVDCTIRDGGLMNNWHFSDDFVKSVYNACVEAGIDYMEIGYKSSRKMFSPKEFGRWKFCDDDDIRKIQEGIKSKTKIVASDTKNQVDELEKELNDFTIDNK